MNADFSAFICENLRESASYLTCRFEAKLRWTFTQAEANRIGRHFDYAQCKLEANNTRVGPVLSEKTPHS